MDIRVDGKVALVTGAAQGIGRAIADTLAASGAAGLLLTDRNAQAGEAAAAALAAAGTAAAFVAADLADPDAPARLVAAALDRFGRLDLLANAAGATDRASFLDATPDDWDRLLAVNARAPFFLMQAAIRAMRARGEGGAIVNIALDQRPLRRPRPRGLFRQQGRARQHDEERRQRPPPRPHPRQRHQRRLDPHPDRAGPAGPRPSAPAGSTPPTPPRPSAGCSRRRRSPTSPSSCSATPPAR